MTIIMMTTVMMMMMMVMIMMDNDTRQLYRPISCIDHDN